MRTLFWIASRNLASRPLFAALAVLGIAFGVATVWAIQIVDLNTVLGVRAHHRQETGTPDLELVARDPRELPPAAALARLRQDGGVYSVTPLLTERMATRPARGAGIDLQVHGVDPATVRHFDPWDVISGRGFRDGDRGVALLGARAAADAKVKVGDRITLERPAVTHQGCVDGEVVVVEGAGIAAGPPLTFEVVGILADVHLARQNRGRTAAVAFEDALALLGGQPASPRWWVRLRPGHDLAAAAKSFEKEFAVRVPQAKEVAETPEERAFRSGVRLASLVALGVGLFIIYHVLTLAVTSWVRQAGLLGALGVTARGLSGVFVIEAAILALLGTGSGLGVGAGIARLMLQFRITTLGWRRPVSTFEIPWEDAGWVALAGVAACLAGAVHPLLRVRRVQPADALAQGEAALARTPAPRWLAPAVIAGGPAAALLVAWFLRSVETEVLVAALSLAAVFGVFVVVLWGLPGILSRGLGAVIRLFERGAALEPWLVRKGLERGVRRLAGSVTGLSLVSAGIVTLHVMTGALKRETDAWAAEALPGHVYLRLEGMPRKGVEALRGIDGVRSVIPVDAAFRLGFEVRGVPPDDVFAEGVLAGDGRKADREAFALGQGMILSSACAREQDLSPGDEVSLPALRGPRKFRVLTVDDRAGFFPHERSFGLIAEAAMRQYFCRSNDVVRQATIGIEDQTSENAVAARVHNRLALEGGRVATVMKGTEQRDFYQREIDTDFLVFDVILGMTAALAALGLLNSLVVSGLERQKELALLRAAGVTRRQVYRLFVAEAAAIGLCGGLLGILMAVPFSWLTVDGLARLSGLPLDYRFDFGWSAIALLAILTLAMLASLLPAARAGRADVAAALKHE